MINKSTNLSTQNISFIALIFLFGFDVRTFIGDYVPISIITSTVILVLLVSYFFLFKKKYFIKEEIYAYDGFIWVFITLYGLRMFYNIFIEQIPQTNFENRSTFIVYYLFLCILPFLIGRKSDYQELNMINFLTVLVLIFFIGLVLSAKQAFVLAATERIYEDARFSGNDLLDTMSYGHLALSFIIALFSLFLLLKSKWKFGLLIPMFFGLLSMGIANSRSPFVALMVVFGVYLAINIRFRTILISFGVILLLILNIDTIDQFFQEYLSSSFISRFMTIFEFDMANSSGRDGLFSQGLTIFFEHPFFGRSIFILEGEAAGLYVHNLILEMLMSIGILGFTIFFIVIFRAIKFSLYLIKQKSKYVFFSMIFLQYFTYLQFSKTIILLPLFWVLIGTLYAINLMENTSIKKKENK